MNFFFFFTCLSKVERTPLFFSGQVGSGSLTPIVRSDSGHPASFLSLSPCKPERGCDLQAGKTNRPPIVQHRAKRMRPRGVAERLYGLGPYVLCALGTLCVCAVRAPPFLSLLPPWLLWLVWLRVRPRLRDVHVVVARLAPARLARDGTLQRPPGAGLASRPDRARAAAGLSTLWAEEAAAWGRSGRSAVLRGRGSGSGPCL